MPLGPKVPALKPSVKVIGLQSFDSFQPDCLYSTERECFLNRGYPFFATFVEARDSRPCPFRTCLPSR